MTTTPLGRLRRALALVVGAMLASGLGAVYLRQGPREVTVDDAVAAFRSSSPAPDATPGVPPAVAPAPTTPVGGDPAVAGTPTSTVAAPSAAGAPASPSPAAPPTGGRNGATGVSSSSGPAAAPPRTTEPSSTATSPDLEEGVYAYLTEGFEATNALGGARHDYPEETPVTMRRTACGWTQRWQPLNERWDESALCRGDGSLDVHRFTTYHEFFQRGQQQQFDCPPGSAVHRKDAAPGATWSWRCTAGASAIDTVVTVVGPEPVVVEGQEVPAVRVRYESTMTGGNRGTQVQERWIRADGLNLRIKTDIDTEADSPFGAVHYEEHYVITIASLRPRR